MTVSLTDFLANLTEIITAITTMFTSVMAVFMEPPLSVFVGMGIFAFVVGIVGRYMLRR